MGAICPKGKISRSKRDKRRAQNWKIVTPNLSECPRCNALMRPHYACSSCGTYNRRSVIEIKEKKSS